MKSLIISFPKAGTYLLSELLQQAGLQPTHWHIGLDRYSNYHDADPALAKSNPRLFDVLSPLSQTIQQHPNQAFSVSHLPLTDQTREALQSVCKVVLLRDPYACLSSQMLWELNSGRHQIRKKPQTWPQCSDPVEMFDVFYREMGRKYIKKYLGVLKWTHEPDVLALGFEQLIGQDPTTLERLQVFLTAHGLVPGPLTEALKRALQSNTLTRSKNRFNCHEHPQLAVFQNVEMKRIQQRMNALKLNA